MAPDHPKPLDTEVGFISQIVILYEMPVATHDCVDCLAEKRGASVPHNHMTKFDIDKVCLFTPHFH